MDVSNNPIISDPTPASPSSNVNPSVGLKKPQYMTNFGRQVGGGIHDKRIVDIWTIKADSMSSMENEIGPTKTYSSINYNEVVAPSTYDGCDCPTCKELNVDCPDCPVCANPIPETDSEVAMAMYDSSIGKADPCWEGYVMRGMKPGTDGSPVPNCIPVTKSLFSALKEDAKDYSKETRITSLFKE